MCGDDERQLRPTGFAVIGYGKLGGIELCYGSDLDLVFMHASRGRIQRTTGKHPIDTQVFFARLGRRIVHILTTQTSQGALYEVDMRLRPSGRAGLLVTSLSAFETYQRDGAWTWEHQALLRARALVGTPVVRTGFERIRRAVLCEAVDRESLRQDVCAMRRRMQRELSRSGADEFDIKQDRGGLADIEFLVQYWVLLLAAEIPQLVRHSDNIRQLEALAGAAIVPLETAERLTDIYRGYRRRLHRLSLCKAQAVAGSDEFTTERAEVSAIWDATLGEPE